jgi:effector-binding domain-containing protein
VPCRLTLLGDTQRCDEAVGDADLAVTVHNGSHANVDQTYGAVGTYVAEHGLALAGPVRETYVVGRRDTADTSRWRTEISWPI